MRPRATNHLKKVKNGGQSTIEYILVVAFGAIFAIQVAKFFNEVFQEGLARLEGNVQNEMQTGREFGG